MGFVHFNENGWIVGKDGNPLYIVGINYIPSYVCANFLKDFRPDAIEKDLVQMEKMGLNAVRFPIYWGYFEPDEGVFEEAAFAHFEQFVRMAAAHGIYSMPWLLVGVATEHADIPFRQGRPLFDGDMLYAAENHLRTFARRYKNEENILFWDICDEPEFYAWRIGNEQWPYNIKRFNHWLKHMYEAFKTEDPNHLVTLGFGSIASANFGYKLLDSAKILDFMSVTCYPYDSSVEGIDTARNNSYVSWYVKMNKLEGKPVFTCEAPGFSAYWFSEGMLGRYFKVSLYGNLVNGSNGVLPWTYNDFAEDIWTTSVLDMKPLEPSFGIITNDGRIKPTGQELMDFGKFVREVKITDYKLPKAKAAIYIPSGYYNDIFHSQRKIRAVMQYIKGCGGDFDYIWDEPDIDLSGYDIVFVVCKDGMKISSWQALRDYVAAGGTLVHDYDGIRGLNPYTNPVFGVEVQTRHKNFHFDRMILNRALGDLPAGAELVFPNAPKDERYSLNGDLHFLQAGTNICGEYLIVEPKGAEVVAEFADGTPALLKHPYGKGTAWLMTGQFHSGLFEIEYEQYKNHMMFPLYDSLLKEENFARPCQFVNSELEVGILEKENGDKLMLLINHAPTENAVELHLDAAYQAMQMQVWDDRNGICAENGTIQLTMEAAEVVKLLFSPQK